MNDETTATTRRKAKPAKPPGRPRGSSKKPATSPGRLNRYVTTTKAVAEHFGIKEQTARKWATAGMPVVRKGHKSVPGRYDLFAIEIWNRQRLARLKKEKPVDLHGEPTDPKERKAHYDAARAKNKWLEESKVLMKRTEHEAMLREAYEWFAQFMAELATGHFAAVLSGKPAAEIKRLIAKKCADARETILATEQ